MKTTIEVEIMENKLPLVHPGEILREDILPEVGLSVTAAAKALGVSRQMLHDILAQRRPLSAAMCLRIAKLFGSSPEMWMRLQSTYELLKASHDEKIAESVRRIVPVKQLDEVLA
jgi:antitoxin HigA-1